LPDSAESESLRMVASIRGHNGSLAFVYRSQENGSDLALVRPAHDHCHAADLPALIDIAGRDDEEVGILGNQRVKVSHHTILPNEAMGPLPGLEGASHHLAPVVDAGGKGGTISRQNREGCESIVVPNGGNDGCAVSRRNIPNSLAVVIDSVGGSSSNSQVWKLVDSAVFPQYGVSRDVGAGSRRAYGLAFIVDALYEAIWFAGQRKKSPDCALVP
jgi:hypothetical protein